MCNFDRYIRHGGRQHHSAEFTAGSLQLKAPRFAAGVLLVCAALVRCPQAFAWGCGGHQTVALIAKENLNPRALAKVNQILTANPIDPSLSRFCQPIATDPMEDASTWADDYRKAHADTGDWHFIDIPRGASKGSYTCDPVKGCVTLALNEQIKILQDPSSDPAAQANALRFIIHFAGDIHQPLHATTNNDRGGNCVPITYFGEKPHETDVTRESFQLNLHGAWDNQLVERAANGQTVEKYSEALNEKFEPQFATWKSEGINFNDWAWDSHELAEKFAYGKLDKKIPIEAPQPVTSCADDNQIAMRMLNLNQKVGPAYASAVALTIEEQLAKSGYRLAMILNQIWR